MPCRTLQQEDCLLLKEHPESIGGGKSECFWVSGKWWCAKWKLVIQPKPPKPTCYVAYVCVPLPCLAWYGLCFALSHIALSLFILHALLGWSRAASRSTYNIVLNEVVAIVNAYIQRQHNCSFVIDFLPSCTYLLSPSHCHCRPGLPAMVILPFCLPIILSHWDMKQWDWRIFQRLTSWICGGW